MNVRSECASKVRDVFRGKRYSNKGSHMTRISTRWKGGMINFQAKQVIGKNNKKNHEIINWWYKGHHAWQIAEWRPLFPCPFGEPAVILRKFSCCNSRDSKNWVVDFPAGPVVENLPSSARNTTSIPGPGTKILYAAGRLNPHTTTREKPACHSSRRPHSG